MTVMVLSSKLVEYCFAPDPPLAAENHTFFWALLFLVLSRPWMQVPCSQRRFSSNFREAGKSFPASVAPCSSRDSKHLPFSYRLILKGLLARGSGGSFQRGRLLAGNRPRAQAVQRE